MAAPKRTRNWLFVFYPESAPDNWADIIEDWQVPVLVSPLHDADVNKETGEIKKPHYHGIVFNEGPKSYNQILELVEQLGVHTCKPCNSVRASSRYLCHLDSKDKTLYEVSDIQCFGGADLSPVYAQTDGDLTSDLVFLQDLCEKLGIVEFADLANEVRMEFPDMLITLSKNTVYFRSFLQSRRAYADKMSYVNLRRKVGRV